MIHTVLRKSGTRFTVMNQDLAIWKAVREGTPEPD
jgi:hypothetical protein